MLTCPYCNAVLPPSPAMVVGQKSPCPRCGEAFTITHLPNAIQTSEPILNPPGSGYKNPVRANRLVGGVVLAVMLVMAGIGLAYALATVKTRRDHDRALPRKQRKPWLLGGSGDVEPNVSPLQLVGLGYLPADTGLIVVFNGDELLDGPPGKDLASRSFQIGDREISLNLIKDLIGLAVEDVEYVVFGLSDRGKDEPDLTPPIHLVVKARPTDGANRIRVALKAGSGKPGKSPDREIRTIYTGTVSGFPVRVWPADNKTVVLGALTGTLEAVPNKPVEGATQLNKELREVIEKRVAANAPVWVAGQSNNWKNTLLQVLIPKRQDVPLLANLDQVRTFALGISPGRPSRIRGAFQLATEAMARELEEQQLQPRQKANPETFKYIRSGEWLEFQLTLDGGG